jgi:hypothetical protein
MIHDVRKHFLLVLLEFYSTLRCEQLFSLMENLSSRAKFTQVIFYGMWANRNNNN